METFELKKGDIFCTRNPMALGRAINFVQKIKSKDNKAEYSHSGIIMHEDGMTFEALWTNKRQNLFTDYQGRKVLIGRHKGMTDAKFQLGWNGIKKHEGKWYAGHRLIFFLIPFAAKYINLGLGVCSELTMKFLYKAKLADAWKSWNPDDVADMIKKWKDYEIIYEGKIE